MRPLHALGYVSIINHPQCFCSAAEAAEEISIWQRHRNNKLCAVLSQILITAFNRNKVEAEVEGDYLRVYLQLSRA